MGGELIREHELGGRAEVLLSPVHGRLDPETWWNGCSGTAFRRASICSSTSTSGSLKPGGFRTWITVKLAKDFG